MNKKGRVLLTSEVTLYDPIIVDVMSLSICPNSENVHTTKKTKP